MNIVVAKGKPLAVSVEVKLVFPTEYDNSEQKAITVSSSDESKGTATSKVVTGGNTHTLTATPEIGYGLDYWEYKGESTNGEWVEAPGSQQKSTYTVTLTEDREYKAVFGLARILYGDVAMIRLNNEYEPIGRDSMPAENSTVKEGDPVKIYFQTAIPCDFPDGYRLEVKAYKGGYQGDAPEEDNRFYFNKGNAPRQYANHFSVGNLTLEEVPYMTHFTVGYQINDGPWAYKTYALNGAILQDTVKAARYAALEALQVHYETTYGEPDTSASKSDTPELLESELYLKYSKVRYLLRNAYEKAYNEIRRVAPTAESIEAALSAAKTDFARIAAIVGLAELPNGAEPYPHKKIAVNLPGAPGFGYVPMPEAAFRSYDANAWGALKAALESRYPGQWSIELAASSTEDGVYLVNILPFGGKGVYNGTSNVSAICYALNGVYANGFSIQTLSDRDAIFIGASENGQFPELANRPDKSDLVWALAALNDLHGAAALADVPAYVEALAIGTKGWDAPGYNINSGKAVQQKIVDDALSALFAAFPTEVAAMTRYDLPDDVMNVMQLIAAIGDITPDSGAAIAAARAAYNALLSGDQAKVPNYAMLTEAEAAYALLTAPAAEYKAALTDVVENNLSKLTLAVSPVGGEWAVVAAARSGAELPNATSYLAALDAQLNSGALGDASKYTDYARIALALTALGKDASSYAVTNKTYPIAEKLTDYDEVAKQGINGSIFALLALDSKPYLSENTAIRNQYVQYLLEAEIPGGGWTLSGTTADPDVTAMALQSLAKYRGESGVNAAIERGLAALKSLQDTAHGGFYSYSQYNSESAAQIVVALTALGIDPAGADWTVGDGANPLTALLTFYDASAHGFRHALSGGANQMATEQAACALVAFDRFTENRNGLYDMSDARESSAVGSDVAAAKSAVESAVYAAAQADATDAESAKSAVGAIVNALNLKGVTATVNAGVFTAAIAGTSEVPNGTNGGYTFTVTLNDGAGTELTTTQLTLTIAATPYAPPSAITVKFRLIGDTAHELTDAPQYADWIAEREVTLKGAGSFKVYDAFVKAVADAGLSQVGAEGNYVSSISKEGTVLSEFGNGSPTSGWKYLVNGVYASEGLKDKVIQNGDSITWHYVNDYPAEDAAWRAALPEVPRLSSIKVVKLPNKSAYASGEQLKLTGLELEVGFAGGAVARIAYSSPARFASLPAHNSALASAGTVPVVLSYQGCRASFSVLVSEAIVPPPPGGLVDKAALVATIARAEALVGSGYTAASWTALQAALTQALEYRADTAATQEDVDARDAALNQAIATLQPGQLATSPVSYSAALSSGLGYLANTATAPSVGTLGGDWSVIALARGEAAAVSKSYYDSYYQRVVDYVKAAGTAKLSATKSTENSRVILAFCALDKDVSDVGGYDLLAPFADFDWVIKQGINGAAFALLALDATGRDVSVRSGLGAAAAALEVPSLRTALLQGDGALGTTAALPSLRAVLIDHILESELAGGGWALNGITADVDTTAMVLQALAPYGKSGSAAFRADVRAALARAVAALATAQASTGGYLSTWGDDCAESVAQVIIALSACGIDAQTDPRFVKPAGNPISALLGFQTANGGFSHTRAAAVDPMASDQANLALVAYARLKSNKNALFDMSDSFVAGSGDRQGGEQSRDNEKSDAEKNGTGANSGSQGDPSTAAASAAGTGAGSGASNGTSGFGGSAAASANPASNSESPAAASPTLAPLTPGVRGWADAANIAEKISDADVALAAPTESDLTLSLPAVLVIASIVALASLAGGIGIGRISARRKEEVQ
ncbi:MAG: DUF4430 domain-containing protein [Coriobacteriales bacterium]|nr:DUF4430 domain-containing protein [Coriobacteriales bacterium]